MKIKDYENIIEETAIYPKEISVSFGPAYCMLGLIEEFQEFCDAVTTEQRAKESGDVIWYVTAFAKEIGTSLTDLFLKISEENYTLLQKESLKDRLALAAGKMKKYYRDGKDYSPEIKVVLCHVLIYIKSHAGIPLHIVLEKNYDKLIKRRETNTLHGEGDNREEK